MHLLIHGAQFLHVFVATPRVAPKNNTTEMRNQRAADTIYLN